MRRVKRTLLGAIAFLLPAVFISACGAKDTPGGGGGETSKQTAPYFTIKNNPQSIDFMDIAESRKVDVSTNVPSWRVREKVDVDWLEASREGSSIKLNVTENPKDAVRTATLLIVGENISKELEVRQLGASPQILVSNSIISVPVTGGAVDFTVTTNVSGFDIKVPEWLKLNPARAAMVETSHSYTVQANKGDNARSANIEIIEKNPTSGRNAVKAAIAISQSGLSSYAPASTQNIVEDIKLKIVSGTDTSHQGTDDIQKAFDGDYGTLYHSNWNNRDNNYFPITLTLNLEKTSDVDYMVYHPRSTGYNGYFKEVEIQYSTDGTSFKKLKDFDFGGSATPTRVSFDSQLKGAKAFRLIVKSGHGDGQGFASAAEIEFFQKNPKSFDYRTLFEDEICSKLKAGITEKEILACNDEFFRNLAFFLLQKKYDEEFRVAEFRAWPNPTIQSAIHKTNPYSQLDNPTGISVKANEDLVVIVGDTHGFDKLSLRVQNLNKPGGDGFGGDYYPLYRGVNKLKIKNPGLAYVMYHMNTLDVENKPKIKIHFASGTVNGYYDKENPKHKGRWKDLLSKAKDPYFDVLGRYVHMTFPTSAYSRYVPDGDALVDRYDKTVNAEMYLLGLHKQGNTPFKNRMYMHVMYHSYMYATWYHTGYNEGTLPSILDMSQYAIWGPAHEIGHMNQTRPGVLWRGMTECTTNIKSAYVQTTIFGQPCRLQVEDLSREYPYGNRYTKAFNSIIVPKAPHSYDNNDVFCQLVPFWQLELYFGKVLGMTPEFEGTKKDGFYPNLYEYYRNNDTGAGGQNDVYTENPKDTKNGHHQTEFAYVASIISGYDLTDFFEKWGFLKPIQRTIKDYSTENLTVTEARANEVKAKIKAKNLTPLGNVPIEYITDNTVNLFKTKPNVVAGSIDIDAQGNTLTLKGWQNAVAYEVLEKATGKLVFVGDAYFHNSANVPKLKLPFSWDSNKYKVVGVSATGARVDAK